MGRLTKITLYPLIPTIPWELEASDYEFDVTKMLLSYTGTWLFSFLIFFNIRDLYSNFHFVEPHLSSCRPHLLSSNEIWLFRCSNSKKYCSQLFTSSIIIQRQISDKHIQRHYLFFCFKFGKFSIFYFILRFYCQSTNKFILFLIPILFDLS